MKLCVVGTCRKCGGVVTAVNCRPPGADRSMYELECRACGASNIVADIPLPVIELAVPPPITRTPEYLRAHADDVFKQANEALKRVGEYTRTARQLAASAMAAINTNQSLRRPGHDPL